MLVRRLSLILCRGLDAVIGLLLVTILALSLAEVTSRWVTHQSLVFIAELNRFLFTWLTFLAVPAVQARGLHFRMSLLSRSLTHHARARLEAAIDLMTVGFALVLLTQGLEIVARTSVQRSSALDIRMDYVYSVIPLSAALMLLFMALRWLEALSEGRLPEPAIEVHDEGQPDLSLPAAELVRD